MSATALGVDLGSHGARAVITHEGAVIAASAAQYGPPRPPARRDPHAWWDSLVAATKALPAGARARIDALAVTGVRGAVAGLAANGDAVTPGYPDFDLDAVAPAREILARYGDEFIARTRCFAFPLAGIPKMMLHNGDARVRWWMGPQDLALWRTTGTPLLSAGSAFRFGILRADASGVDDALVKALGVDPDAFAPLVPVGELAGTVCDQAARALGIPVGARVVAAPGDVPAALMAATGGESGRAFVNLGTTIVTTAVVPDALPAGVSCEVLPGGARAAETGRGAGMATVEWCAALLDTEPEALELLAAGADRAGVPEMEPDLLDPWGSGVGGALRRLVPATGPAELACGVLHAVAGAAAAAIDELIAAVGPLREIVVGGGGAACAPIIDRLRATRAETLTIAAGRELAAEGAARVATRCGTGPV